MFKIELCAEQTFGFRVLSTEYLDIDAISDYTSLNHFYPTLGPCHIDLYSEPDNLRIKSNALNNSNLDLANLKDFSDLVPIQSEPNNSTKLVNRSYVSVNGFSPGGGDYVARMLVQISSRVLSNFLEERRKYEKIFFDLVANNQKEFTLFMLISECSMIDPKYQLSDLSFQLCIGKIF